MMDRDDIFSMAQQRHLLPDHTYSHNYGGEPLEIPRLSWEGLRAFHSTHYHPSNAIFFTYGDFPLEGHLERISRDVLDKFEKIDAKTDIPPQERWETQRREKIASPPEPMSPDPSKQTAVSVSYLLDPTADILNSRLMSVLSKLLMDGPNSPFFQTLIEPNIGMSFSPASGYCGSGRQGTFSVGLKGIDGSDVEKVTSIIESTFEQSARDGFNQDRVEGIIHQMELSMKRDSSRFGLDLLQACLPLIMHGARLEDVFSFQKHLDQIKEYRDWAGLVKENFMDNPHKLTLVMQPDPSYQESREQEEKELLSQRVGELTDAGRNQLFQSGLELKKEQSRTQDLSCLPCLSVSDIPREQPLTRLDHASLDGTPVQICPLPTNGVTYLSFLADEDRYPDGMYRYLPFLCSVLTHIGANNMDFRQRATQIERYTSGLSISPLVVPHHTDLHTYDFSTYFRSHCLEQNLQIMLSLWQDTFLSPDFSNREIIRSILSAAVADGVGGISYNGHLLAMAQAGSALNPASKLSEELSGLSQIAFLNGLAKQPDLQETVSILQTLAAKTLHAVNLKAACNLREEVVDETMGDLSAFFDAIPGDRTDSVKEFETEAFVPMRQRLYTQFPFQVHFVSRAIQTVPYNHPHQPILSLVARVMTNKVLHSEIREKGGAYGGGARQGENIFYFFSYRDPNFLPTLQVFKRAVEWVLEGRCTEQDLLEAKLALFQALDAPVTSGKKGAAHFKSRITHEMRQRRRERLLDATREELVEVCRQHLSGEVPDSVAVLGPAETEIPEVEGWEVSSSQLC